MELSINYMGIVFFVGGQVVTVSDLGSIRGRATVNDKYWISQEWCSQIFKRMLMTYVDADCY